MTIALKLPGLKAGAVVALTGKPSFRQPATNDALTLDAALDALSQVDAPNVVLGSETTPTVYWLAALRRFPDSIKLVSTRNGWINLDTGEKVEPGAAGQAEVSEAAAEPKSRGKSQDKPGPEPESKDTNEQAAVPDAPRTPQRQQDTGPEHVAEPAQAAGGNENDPRHMPEPKLIGRGFFWALRGPHNNEGKRNLDALRAEVLRRSVTNPKLKTAFEKAVANGFRAFDLLNEAKKRLAQGHTRKEVEQWLRVQTRGVHENVYNAVVQQLEKNRQWLESRRKAAKVSCSTLKPLKFTGSHPNSLSHLPPTDTWTFYVDETGQQFTPGEAGADGRVVTVAVPDYTKLPELPAGAHGTEDSPAAVDKRVATLISNQVGIFGFTATDQHVASGSWISAISDLVRWAALQTPVKGVAPRFSFVIEQRGYQDSAQVSALAETLEDTLRALRPETLGNLRISLHICGKREDPHLAYADAVACTWGGKLPANKDRLRKTRWVGHCLLNQETQSALRLLLALDERYRLLPQEWYGLLADASRDGLRTQVGEYLDKLGARVQQDPGLWRTYLAEVQYRLAHKDYRPATLADALEWLDRFAPAETRLPPRARLAWYSARLAADNHEGRINRKVSTILAELAVQLLDEVPDDAVQAMLRLAVTATNAFEFASMERQVKQWLENWGQRIGRLNRGKLLSTLGQLAAFQGRETEALTWFDQALDTFAGLSDPDEAARESAQTRIYRFIACLDAPREQISAGALLEALGQHLESLTHLPDPTLADAAERARDCAKAVASDTLSSEQVALLAISGPSWRFAQHLLLRTLVTLPEETADAREICLAVRDDWQTDDGHPWPLIQAYRAALLQNVGETDAAVQHMQDALSALDTAPQGSVLAWMRDALQLWGNALGMVSERPDPQRVARWADDLPAAPWQAMQQWAGQTLVPEQAPEILRTLLPFNFH